MSYTPEAEARLRAEAGQVIGRYPTGHERSALLPLLHLVQSEDGYVSPDGIALCADLLGITRAEVSAVATFYTQYKRHPTGDHLVGVCTNALCAVMGGDEIWEAVSKRLGVGTDETNEEGTITLERIECNAACDYAPVVMVNWEFFDNQTPESAVALVDDLEAGRPVHPTRGPDTVPTFRENEHTLAGFLDDHADEGVSAGEASLVGLRIADDHGWTAPTAQPEASAEAPAATTAPPSSPEPPEPSATPARPARTRRPRRTQHKEGEK